MAIKAGQLKERADYQAYILEMLRAENGYQVRPSTCLLYTSLRKEASLTAWQDGIPTNPTLMSG